jgi:hypothetical protein
MADDDDELDLSPTDPAVTDERIRSLLRGAPDIRQLTNLKEDDEAFRLLTFSIKKHQPKYSNGWSSDLRPTSRFYKRWFDLPDIGVRGWAVIFRIHDPDGTPGTYELMPGWVPPEGERDADRWIEVLNGEIRDRLAGKNYPLGPYSHLALTDEKLRFLLKLGGQRLYSLKELDDQVELLALCVSKVRPEFMTAEAKWRPLRRESRLYKRWFELADGPPVPPQGWALIFRMFDPEGTPTEEYEYFAGWVPPEKEPLADQWIERINALIHERLQANPTS